MCDTCGYNITSGNQSFARQTVKGTTAVTVLKKLLAKNDDQAILSIDSISINIDCLRSI